MIGKLNKEMLDSILETMPLQISVVDAEDRVVGWNNHDTRIFRRPESVIGRNVRDCHPRKSLDKVEKIINEMKEGKRDRARFWIDIPVGDKKEIRKVMIEYYALRNSEGKYLGCLEASQDITDIQKLKGQKRLLD
jgi:PAS domain S-box-containing protein